MKFYLLIFVLLISCVSPNQLKADKVFASSSGVEFFFDSDEKPFYFSHYPEDELSAFNSPVKNLTQIVASLYSNDNLLSLQNGSELNVIGGEAGVLVIVLGLAGGLAFFLFGIEMLSRGLLKSAGDKIRGILSNITENRLIAIAAGAFATVMTQSSGTTSAMLVSFVNSKLMKFRQTTALLLGTGIGTTVTAQLIAFRITEYSLLLVAGGFALYGFSKTQFYKNMGESLLGMGLLFYGMFIMSEAVIPLRTYEPLTGFLTGLEVPVLGILLGMLFTMLLQSSAAFIGVIIIFASQGMLSLEASIPLMFGSSIGTAFTAAIASIRAGREARKVAAAVFLFKTLGVLLFVWWISPFATLVESVSPAVSGDAADSAGVVPRQIANAHTIYNILVAFVLLPFTGFLGGLIDRLIPPVREKPEFDLKVKHLDDSLLKTPALALNVAKQEVIRMGMTVKEMVNDFLPAFLEKNKNVLSTIEEKEKKVNFLRDRVNEYLIKVSNEGVSGERTNESFQMFYTVKELEQIADVVSSRLYRKAIAWIDSDYEFSEQGKKEILESHKNTLKQLSRALEVFSDINLEKAQEMEKKHRKYREVSFDMERQHYQRLESSVEKSIQSSQTHLELITMLRVITSHSTNIGRILLKWSESDKKRAAGN